MPPSRPHWHVDGVQLDDRRANWWLNRSDWWLNRSDWWLNRSGRWLNRSDWWLNRSDWWLNRSDWWLNRSDWWLNRFGRCMAHLECPLHCLKIARLLTSNTWGETETVNTPSRDTVLQNSQRQTYNISATYTQVCIAGL